MPEAVSSLWAPSELSESSRSERETVEDGEASPLRCNRTSGKVEPVTGATPPGATPSVPWVTRRISSAQELVRRSVSFVLGGLDELSIGAGTAEPSQGRMRSKGRVSFGLGGSHGNLRSTLDEASLDSIMSSRRSSAASPYPEWA